MTGIRQDHQREVLRAACEEVAAGTPVEAVLERYLGDQDHERRDPVPTASVSEDEEAASGLSTLILHLPELHRVSKHELHTILARVRFYRSCVAVFCRCCRTKQGYRTGQARA
jgi:hypothetical protein